MAYLGVGWRRPQLDLAAEAQPVSRLETMPIKSKAQRRKFAELLVKGEISPETFEEWNRAAGDAELPERLHPKVAVRPKRKIKPKRTTKAKTARSKTASARKKSRPPRKRR